MRLKSIFLGNNVPQLETLIKNSDIKAIFIKDDLANFNFQSIVKLSIDNKISLYMPKTMKRERNEMAYQEIKRINPDIIISGGYHLVVPEYIIGMPKYGTFNIHPAPLPKYRGQHVIQWQLINDEKETGTTVHYMDKSLDTGDIVKQLKISIDENDDAYTLWKKTSNIGAELLKELLSEISEGKEILSCKQDESKASYYNKRKFEDGKIDWNKNAREISNLTRALVKPWPGAYFEFKDNRYVLDKISYIDDHTNIPGLIMDKYDDKLVIGTGDGRVIVNKNNIRNYDGNLCEFTKREYISSLENLSMVNK